MEDKLVAAVFTGKPHPSAPTQIKFHRLENGALEIDPAQFEQLLKDAAKVQAIRNIVLEIYNSDGTSGDPTGARVVGIKRIREILEAP